MAAPVPFPIDQPVNMETSCSPQSTFWLLHWDRQGPLEWIRQVFQFLVFDQATLIFGGSWERRGSLEPCWSPKSSHRQLLTVVVTCIKLLSAATAGHSHLPALSCWVSAAPLWDRSGSHFIPGESEALPWVPGAVGAGGLGAICPTCLGASECFRRGLPPPFLLPVPTDPWPPFAVRGRGSLLSASPPSLYTCKCPSFRPILSPDIFRVGQGEVSPPTLAKSVAPVHLQWNGPLQRGDTYEHTPHVKHCSTWVWIIINDQETEAGKGWATSLRSLSKKTVITLAFYLRCHYDGYFPREIAQQWPEQWRGLPRVCWVWGQHVHRIA